MSLHLFWSICFLIWSWLLIRLLFSCKCFFIAALKICSLSLTFSNIYDLLQHGLLCVFLLIAHWVSWTCTFLHSVKFGTISANISFNAYFNVPICLSCPDISNYMCICFISFIRSLRLYLLFFIIFLIIYLQVHLFSLLSLFSCYIYTIF